jgi:hypothetical protein
MHSELGNSLSYLAYRHTTDVQLLNHGANSQLLSRARATTCSDHALMTLRAGKDQFHRAIPGDPGHDQPLI